MATLRGGFTTGSCAAAAAKAATMLLSHRNPGASVVITLPDGAHARFDIHRMDLGADHASAVIIKDAGDDPDVTNGAHVTVAATWNESDEVKLVAGEGIGTATLPGLQVEPGEPAINPVPREMIVSSVREVTDRGVTLTLSIPGGNELARRTFNSRLGITGGLSILGTTGRVKPFSCEAVRETHRQLVCVAEALGVKDPVLVPGNIGARAAATLLTLADRQLLQVGNDWGFALDALATRSFNNVLVLGHPGKLAKLPAGHWDTHSARSPNAVEFVTNTAAGLLGAPPPESVTVEGVFSAIPEDERTRVACGLAELVRKAVAERLRWAETRVAVMLVSMTRETLGSSGDTNRWRRTEQ